MLSIVERQGPEKLEALAASRALPELLSLPDVAVVLARELIMSREPPAADVADVSAAFMNLVLEFMQLLTDAVLCGSLKCGAKLYRADPSDKREQYSMSVVSWPWLSWNELVYDYLVKVKDYTDGKLADKPTLERESGLIDVRVMRADFRDWCERQRLQPLPAAWFTDAEIAEHTVAISKPAAGARQANARFDEARRFAEQVYRNSLAEDGDAKPGSVARTIRGAIEGNLSQFGLTSVPTVDTIKGWLMPLAPEQVRRPGRPRK